MMTKKGSTQIVNFVTLRSGVLLLGHGHISNIVKMHYFFSSSCPHWDMDQTNLVYCNDMTKEGPTKIFNIMTPGVRVLVLRRDHINHIVSTLSIYNTLIAIVLRDYDAAFLCHCGILFIL